LKTHEIEHIRKVFDEDALGKKFCAVTTPREDAQMFRESNKAAGCECIVELYELLWRWGHRSELGGGFAQNFGFAIPDTVVIVKGRPYAWYFISKKDGQLLRKTASSLSLGAVEKKFCKERGDAEDATRIVATWYPMASQFPEARRCTPYAEFLTLESCRNFIGGLDSGHSGALQLFVEPYGVSNFLVRTVSYGTETSLQVRTNRCLLAGGVKRTLFDRAATFEGWDGLSSTQSTYRNHKHPHMEEVILAAGETLNVRIEEEHVRKMLELSAHQHVALHFKVAKDHMLFFIFGSVVTEKEVILQTRPQLLMGDPVMTDPLPGQALLPGGTDKKAIPHEVPAVLSHGWEDFSEFDDGSGVLEDDEVSAVVQPPQFLPRGAADRPKKLPPLRGDAASGSRSSGPSSARGRGEQPQRRPPRPLSGRRNGNGDQERTLLPRPGGGSLRATKPAVPPRPFRLHSLPSQSMYESAHYDYPAAHMGPLDTLKYPLISPTGTRSEPPSARLLLSCSQQRTPREPTEEQPTRVAG
jgi:hypothetical protein